MTSEFHSVWISGNSLQNLLLSDVGTGGSAGQRSPTSTMQMKIITDDGSPIAQIGASGGSLSIVPCSISWSGPFQNLGSEAVVSRICKTCSQIRVSREQNCINFCCKMSICANSLLNSCNSGIKIGAHSLRSHQLADHFPRS